MRIGLVCFCKLQLLGQSLSFSGSSPSKSAPLVLLKENMMDMEKEVKASAQLQMDQQRVVSALDTRKETSLNNDPEKAALMASPWQISAAAGISAFVGCECITHSNFLSAAVLVGVVLSAYQNPVDDEGLFGAVSRLLGRATIQTVESSKPRLQRIARAAIIDDGDEDYFKTASGRQRMEDPRLVQYIEEIELENARLLKWKEQRELVDQYSSYYSLDNLQSMAKEHGIEINCRKAQLMMRLVEAEIIHLH